MTPRQVFAQPVSDDEVTQVTLCVDEPTRVDLVLDEPTRIDLVFDEPTPVAPAFDAPTRVTRQPHTKSRVRTAIFVLLPVALALAGAAHARPSRARAHASPGRVEIGVATAATSREPKAPPRAPAPPPPAVSTSRPIAAAQSHRDGPPPDERAAVDAVASGAYARAARLYDALAASHPEREAYREAARIARAASSTTEERP